MTAVGPLFVDKMQIIVKQTKTFIHDGLYDFIRDINRSSHIERNTNKATQSLNIDLLCQRISPIIPKVSVTMWKIMTITETIFSIIF